jgi:hypothetical protein
MYIKSNPKPKFSIVVPDSLKQIEILKYYNIDIEPNKYFYIPQIRTLLVYTNFKKFRRCKVVFDESAPLDKTFTFSSNNYLYTSSVGTFLRFFNSL